MHVDPKAPADSPLHPSNIGRAQESEPEQPADSPSMDELLETHRTSAELADDLRPDRDELQRRAQLVAEHDEDPDPEYAPTLVDLTGMEHRWEGEDGWQPVEPEDTQGDAEQDQAEESSQDAEPEKPQPKKRTGRHRKTTKDTPTPDLEAALAKLDATRGKKK